MGHGDHRCHDDRGVGASDLFARRGIRAVGINEIVEQAGIAKATLYKHFGSKDDLVRPFLAEREQSWTFGWVEAEARQRGTTPEEQLLAIFDLFDEWFHRNDFEGYSFINVLLEMNSTSDSRKSDEPSASGRRPSHEMNVRIEPWARPMRRAMLRIDSPRSSASVGSDFAYAETTGPKPPGTALVNRYMDRIMVAAQRDDGVSLRFNEVVAMTRRPESLFAPRFLLRVLRAARRHAGPPASRP